MNKQNITQHQRNKEIPEMIGKYLIKDKVTNKQIKVLKSN